MFTLLHFEMEYRLNSIQTQIDDLPLGLQVLLMVGLRPLRSKASIL